MARGAIGSLGLKTSLVGFVFLTNLILARSLGTAEYGVYAFVLAWANLLGVLVQAGVDSVVVREVAAGQARLEWGIVRGLLRWSNQVVLALAFVIGLLAAVAALGIARQTNWSQLPAFLIALTLLPLLALTRMRQAAMQGLQHVVAGQLPEAVVQPLIFIGLLTAGHLLLGWALLARTAVTLYVIATLSALIVGAAVLHFTLPQPTKLAAPIYRSREWISSALPLLLVNGMGVMNTQAPVLLLGAIKGAQTAGLFAVAARGADLVAFGLVSINLALAPVAAGLWVQRDTLRLQRVVSRSVRAALIFTVPVAAVLIIFGAKFLSIFGAGFVAAKPAMTILIVGQLMNVAMGSVGLMLIMTGHERDVAIATVVCGCLNIALNLLMIPLWGLVGAAVAVAISLIGWNVGLAVCVKRKLGIHSTALGLR